ncbi:hypothetical protein [Hymenobacter defluvii]|uniref:Uncharacterized protein n=1 Tax=Hymenobacter defluvii TaxID=2054411 RepID=A0ABS3TI17_9BACT|nr:hypothetical protein [Hymenobacter defluvii]MBO3272340.1 hypothetical protein [Hymenobacter defluvii]
MSYSSRFPRPVCLLSLALSLALLSCEKEPVDRLPAATQKGKNTAGFLVDGEAWLPKPSTLNPGNNPVNGYWAQTTKGPILGLSFSDKSLDTPSGLSITLRGVLGPGTYPLNQEPHINLGEGRSAYGSYYRLEPAPAVRYYTGPTATGTVTLTRLDLVKHIASGTFEFTPLEDGGTRTVQITKGRFDVRLRE